MVRVKICGIRNYAEARMAVDCGAHALGFIFAPSRRRINPAAAREIIMKLPPFVTRVGVFVNAPRYEVQEIASFCGLQVLQFHGDEGPDYCQRWPGYQVIKAIRVAGEVAPEQLSAYQVDGFLFDTPAAGKYGGSGETFNWEYLRSIRRQVGFMVLAGGLRPENVYQAIAVARPDAVDVASGVEGPAGKELRLMRRLMAEVERWNRQSLEKGGEGAEGG